MRKRKAMEKAQLNANVSNLKLAFYCKTCHCYDCYEHAQPYLKMLENLDEWDKNRPIQVNYQTLKYYQTRKDC